MDAGTVEVPAAGGRLTGEALRAPQRRPTTCSRSSRPPARRTSAGSTTSPASPTWPPSAACGCTSTGPTASARCARRARGRASPGSSAPTRSSSTRTSGCTRRSTAARCCTASRPTAAPRTASTPSYLDAMYAEDDDAFNPSDYGVHLTRRARGLPFWFSLAVHGTDAYAEAVEHTLAVTRLAADEIRARPQLELLAEPELTVLVLRRRGWRAEDYARWSVELRRSGRAFVLPTTVGGEPAARIALVNPRTTRRRRSDRGRRARGVTAPHSGGLPPSSPGRSGRFSYAWTRPPATRLPRPPSVRCSRPRSMRIVGSASWSVRASCSARASRPSPSAPSRSYGYPNPRFAGLHAVAASWPLEPSAP